MLRHAMHAIAAVLLWAVFGYYWWIVLRRPMNPDTRTALSILAILVLAGVIFLTAWVFHNIRIYRTRQRRKERRKALADNDRDYLGRRIVMDDPYMLLRSNYIEVEVTGAAAPGGTVEEKTFRARDERDTGWSTSSL